MRHLLLTTLLLSSISSAQETLTEADKAALSRNKSGKPTLLKTYKLATPTTSAAQHQQTDLDFLGERAEVSTDTTLVNGKRGDFSCPDGSAAACLDTGDKVCPATSKCIDEHATCFDAYPCDLNSGFVCASQYDDLKSDCKNAVTQNNELVSENVALREKRLAQKNCVMNASTLKKAKRCVR